MRGSGYQQLMTLLRLMTRIGVSRHTVKLKLNGLSPYIHSAGTLDKIFQRLRPLIRWLWSHGIRDLELLSPSLIQLYLKGRLEHHTKAGNCRQSYLVELSAIATLERCLNVFSLYHRGSKNTYKFNKQRKEASLLAKGLPRKSPSHRCRAIPDPLKTIEQIKITKHRLMAQLQWESGCRTEGVGAPRRGSNPFSKANFYDPETGKDLGFIPDPVTNEIMAPLWTVEKGGKLAFKFCSPNTRKRLLSFLTSDEDKLEEGYCNYLRSINKALALSNQAGKGIGTHGFRFAFARRRYKECLRNGYTDEQAKHLVSQEMSHNRADITETYL